MKDVLFWLVIAANIIGASISAWSYFHDSSGTIACNGDGTVSVTNVTISGVKFRDHGELAERYAAVCRFSRS